jgi:hypothetical protein
MPSSGIGMKKPQPNDLAMLNRDYVQSLERGLAVIKAFGPEQSTLTLAEAAAKTGLTRAATRRFLLTLAKLGPNDTPCWSNNSTS